MGIAVGQAAPTVEAPVESQLRGQALSGLQYVARNKQLLIGLIMLGALAAFVIIGFAAAYYGGRLDAVVKGMVDVALTIPTFLVLIIVAISIHSAMTVPQMALVVAALAWLWPTRTIRAQVLTMRERAYVHVARLSGASNLKVIFFELMPNLLPYLAASLVAAVAAAVLASLG